MEPLRGRDQGAHLLVPEPLGMAGQLQINPLPELIREISAGGLSGALRLVRERAKTVVYFDAGETIFAVSNLRAFRLAESVRRWKILTDEQLAGFQEKTSDLEFGAALVEAGTLRPEMLDSLLARQVSELLYQTLLWTEGDWDFDPRVRLANDTRVVVKTNQLLFESARHLPAEFVTARFADKAEKIFPEAASPDNLGLLPTEAFVLSRIDAGLSLNELLTVSGLPETETLQAIYTLALGGFLRREKWPQALSEKETAAGRMVSAIPARQGSTVGKEAKIKGRPEAKTTAPVGPRDEQGEVEALFARLHVATDHYQALGIRRSANVDEIKRAYYALAKRFHPDRFRRDVDAARLANIETAFAQVAQAYETLKDTNARAVYDSKLLKKEQDQRFGHAAAATNPVANDIKPDGKSQSGGDASFSPDKSPQEPTADQAEEIFQRGFAALQQGNSAIAIASLGEAARLAPTEPRYRAHFARALARDVRLRHSAEAEFKAAIGLEAKNASYRVMLAEFYSEVGLLKRAQGELDRAFAIDPHNADARRLRDKLKRR